MKSFHVGPVNAPAENNDAITALVAGAVTRPAAIGDVGSERT